MADVALQPNRATTARGARKRSSLHNLLHRKSTIAFLMALPLILLIVIKTAIDLQLFLRKGFEVEWKSASE